MTTINVTIHVHNYGASAHELRAVNQRLDTLMGTIAQAVADIQALTGQVAKIGTETTALLQKIADLTAIIEAGGASNTTPEFDEALAALKAQAAVVDDLVPDLPPA